MWKVGVLGGHGVREGAEIRVQWCKPLTLSDGSPCPCPWSALTCAMSVAPPHGRAATSWDGHAASFIMVMLPPSSSQVDDEECTAVAHMQLQEVK